MTLQHSLAINSPAMDLPLTLSAGVSPAKTLVQPVEAQGSKVLVPVYGHTTPDLLAKLDPVGSLLRTALCFALGEPTGYLGTWSEKATPAGRSWWVLSMPGHPISGSGFSFLPTVTVCGNYNRKGCSATSGDGLATVVRRMQFLPTPTVTDAGSGRYNTSPGGLPRPTLARWAKDKTSLEQPNGPLNPPWVEWLMGFPLGWTELPLSVTQLFRKSRKQSVEQS